VLGARMASFGWSASPSMLRGAASVRVPGGASVCRPRGIRRAVHRGWVPPRASGMDGDDEASGGRARGAEQGTPLSDSSGDAGGGETMWGMQTFIRASGKAGCTTCRGTGAKPCGQCGGGGVNREDLFQGRFKKGEVCWLCKGSGKTMCGDCAGDMTDAF
jgi:hypothetical protein